MPRQRVLNDAQSAILERDWPAGVDAEQIRLAVNAAGPHQVKSLDNLYHAVRLRGLTRPDRWTPEQKSIMRRDYPADVPSFDIVQAVNAAGPSQITVQQLSMWAKKLGLKRTNSIACMAAAMRAGSRRNPGKLNDAQVTILEREYRQATMTSEKLLAALNAAGPKQIRNIKALWDLSSKRGLKRPRANWLGNLMQSQREYNPEQLAILKAEYPKAADLRPIVAAINAVPGPCKLSGVAALIKLASRHRVWRVYKKPPAPPRPKLPRVRVRHVRTDGTVIKFAPEVRGKPGVWQPPVTRPWADIQHTAMTAGFHLRSKHELPSYNKHRVAQGWPPLAILMRAPPGPNSHPVYGKVAGVGRICLLTGGYV